MVAVKCVMSVKTYRHWIGTGIPNHYSLIIKEGTYKHVTVINLNVKTRVFATDTQPACRLTLKKDKCVEHLLGPSISRRKLKWMFTSRAGTAINHFILCGFFLRLERKMAFS